MGKTNTRVSPPTTEGEGENSPWCVFRFISPRFGPYPDLVSIYQFTDTLQDAVLIPTKNSSHATREVRQTWEKTCHEIHKNHKLYSTWDQFGFVIIDFQIPNCPATWLRITVLPVQTIARTVPTCSAKRQKIPRPERYLATAKVISCTVDVTFIEHRGATPLWYIHRFILFVVGFVCRRVWKEGDQSNMLLEMFTNVSQWSSISTCFFIIIIIIIIIITVIIHHIQIVTQATLPLRLMK